MNLRMLSAAAVVALIVPGISAQVVDVDVNWNIEHSVGGISDFGRERHITVHSAVTDPDWNGQEDKLDYLMNDLDVYFGRDNGSATWKFSNTPEDPERPNYPDLSYVTNWSAWWDTQYDANVNRLQYEDRATEMIMGHNPHPVYPTLSWYDNGFTWTGWQPLSIESSAEYVITYLDQAFRRNSETSGEQPPKYWEVINEPDMLLMTGQFMVSNWESIFEYHNLVATGVKERMGEDAPLIGGMTWGQHDFQIADGVSRYSSNYLDQWIEEPAATFYREAGTTQWPDAGDNWDQWDKIWQGFVDHCGSNMDFYSVHIYDWPGRGLGGTGRLRTGGHTEGMLDIMEWYDVHKFGAANRKPIVLSEYGSVAGYITASQNGPHVDWECLRPFNSMMMQFLERPDYIVKSMPFTPIKASWGDYSATQRYPYSMLDETSYGNGEWEWTGYIKWFELWADVDGTRVETKASDPDILVDAYVNGDHAFLILNNLETTAADINLHEFGLGTGVDSVRIKHLYCENYADYTGTSAYPVLDDYTLQTAPGSITLDPEATLIIRYNFAGSFTPAATLVESKVFGEKLAADGLTNPRGGELFRVQDQVFSGNINGVTVPAGPAEAVLRISGSFVESTLTSPRANLDYIRINGHDLPYLTDWRGQENGTAGGWGQLYTLEVPVPVEYLQANNVVSGQFNNTANRYAAISLQIFDFSQAPGRYGETVAVPVTAMSITEATLSMPEQREGSVTAVITPANATDKAISWSSSNSAVASVDPNTGRITAVGAGSATITATTSDGAYSDNVAVTVTAFTPFAVEGVRVNPANVTVLLDQTNTLVATILPENTGNTAVTWSSSDPSVATVDASGEVIAIGEGSATITATTADGGHTDTTAVSVPPPLPVSGVTVAPASALIESGTSLQLSAVITPTDAYDQSVTWTSLNPSAATVNASGLVTAVGEGVAEIQATTGDGGFMASCAATVFAVGPDGVSLTVEAEDFDATGGVLVYSHASGQGINYVEANDWAEYNIDVPTNGVYKIVYQISTPQDGSAIAFSLNGVTVATDAVPNNGDWDAFQPLQSSGYVSMSAGPHTVRVTAGSNAWQWNLDKFVLTRVADGGDPVSVESVSVSPASSLIAAGNTEQLTATVLPVNATDKSVTWSSLNPSIATVSSGGLISAVTEGVASIVVTTSDGGFSATNAVTVTPGAAVTGVSVSPMNSTIQIDGTVQLSETITPADALNKNVTWTSLDPSIATVSAGGLVRGWSKGTAEIVVTTVDGGFTATNTTTVVEPPPEGPVLHGLAIDGGMLYLSLTNGTSEAKFRMLSSTNLVEGAGWTVIASNLMFDVQGDSAFTNTLDGAEQRFYKAEEGEDVPPSPTASATFDWEEFSGNWWEGYGYSQTDSDYTLAAGGRAAAHDGGDGVGGTSGFAFKAAYSQDSVDGTFTLEDGSGAVDFVVTSIDISASTESAPQGAPLVRGMLSGVEQWAIDPTEDVGFQTYTSSTTGDMSLEIDQIVWSAPYDPADSALTWDNKIDNLSVQVALP